MNQLGFKCASGKEERAANGPTVRSLRLACFDMEKSWALTDVVSFTGSIRRRSQAHRLLVDEWWRPTGNGSHAELGSIAYTVTSAMIRRCREKEKQITEGGTGRARTQFPRPSSLDQERSRDKRTCAEPSSSVSHRANRVFDSGVPSILRRPTDQLGRP